MNYLLGVIFVVLISYQYYQSNDYQLLDYKFNSQANSVSLPKDKVVKVLAVKEPVKAVIQTKIRKSRLKKSRVQFIGIGLANGKIYALINNGRKTKVVMVGDEVSGSEVISITAEELRIKGYKVIGFQRPKLVISSPISGALIDKTITPPISAFTRATEPRHEPKSLIIPKPTPTKTTPTDLSKKYIVLKSLVNEALLSPSSITKYFTFKKEIDGISIRPKSEFNNLYNSIGFKLGDRIVKVNNKSVNSISLLVGMANIKNNNQINLLLSNAGKYRLLNVNLMKVHKN
jgi:type II secretory pathway component PulC